MLKEELVVEWSAIEKVYEARLEVLDAPMKKLVMEKVPAALWRGMTAAQLEPMERMARRTCLVNNMLILERKVME